MPRPTPMTVKELLNHCKALVKDGQGDKQILISDDEEGNGYHFIWYDFTTDEDSIKECMDISSIYDLDPSKVVILG